jgi:hypothetical protein
MSSEDVDYYRERAAKAREAERTAATPAIAETYSKLAVMYENLLDRVLAAQSEQDVDPLSATGS